MERHYRGVERFCRLVSWKNPGRRGSPNGLSPRVVLGGLVSGAEFSRPSASSGGCRPPSKRELVAASFLPPQSISHRWPLGRPNSSSQQQPPPPPPPSPQLWTAKVPSVVVCFRGGEGGRCIERPRRSRVCLAFEKMNHRNARNMLPGPPLSLPPPPPPQLSRAEHRNGKAPVLQTLDTHTMFGYAVIPPPPLFGHRRRPAVEVNVAVVVSLPDSVHRPPHGVPSYRSLRVLSPPIPSPACLVPGLMFFLPKPWLSSVLLIPTASVEQPSDLVKGEYLEGAGRANRQTSRPSRISPIRQLVVPGPYPFGDADRRAGLYGPPPLRRRRRPKTKNTTLHA
ncbi:hypothetical protein LZ31DRAFT_149132 [Colletotrichum somersetense]|nr:hypothetical protein LZ31DRAFT_149132 [Colletotrichum somersetense]